MRYPKISVIMPVYNAEKYLKYAIKSILDQTFKDFELLIIDDDSNDGSKNIIEFFSNKDKRIICLKNKKNMGVYTARTIGVKKARGKYIANTDADDISASSRFKKQYDFLEKHNDYGVVGGYIELFESETGKIIGLRKYHNEDSKLRRRIFLYSPVAEPIAMIRKDVFSHIGYYDSNYRVAGDLDFWFRLGCKYKFSNIQEVLLKYRIHKESLTYSRIKDMETRTLEIRKKYSRNYCYQMTIMDKIINSGIKNTDYIPYRFKIWLFNFLRNSKIYSNKRITPHSCN